MEMKDKYRELMARAIDSNDDYKMRVVGDIEAYFFDVLSEKYPDLARQWIEKLEAMEWNNYLTKAEAEEIVKDFQNQDGSRGAHWSYDIFKAAVESPNAPLAEPPYFNCWAMWAVANMKYSDHSRTLTEIGVPSDKIPNTCYRLAKDNLKDVDRPHFVKDYWHL